MGFPGFDTFTDESRANSASRSFASIEQLKDLQVRPIPTWVGKVKRFALVSSAHSGTSVRAAIGFTETAGNNIVSLTEDLDYTMRELRVIRQDIASLERREEELQSVLKIGKESDKSDRMSHQIEMLELRGRLGRLLTDKSAKTAEVDSLSKLDELKWRPRRNSITHLKDALQVAIARHARLIRLANYD